MKELAFKITSRYHGEAAASQARDVSKARSQGDDSAGASRTLALPAILPAGNFSFKLPRSRIIRRAFEHPPNLLGEIEEAAHPSWRGASQRRKTERPQRHAQTESG